MIEKDFERIKDMITHGKYFCSSPKAFNDVFDCKPVMSFDVSDKEYINGYIQIARQNGDGRLRKDLIREARTHIGTDNDPRSEFFTNRAQDKYNEFADTWGVFCLAESPSNILMWAHYAASYTGICMEIETGKFGNISPVGYSENRPVITWLENTPIAQKSRKGLYTKSSHWSYEDEWRVMHLANKALELGPGTVRRIIFGPNCSALTIEKIIEIVRQAGQDIALAKAVPNTKKFEIDIVEFESAK